MLDQALTISIRNSSLQVRPLEYHSRAIDSSYISPPFLEPPPKRRKTKTGYEPDFSSADRGRGAQKPLDDRVGIGGWDDGGGNWGVDCECWFGARYHSLDADAD
jgi:hypothetical protein